MVEKSGQPPNSAAGSKIFLSCPWLAGVKINKE